MANSTNKRFSDAALIAVARKHDFRPITWTCGLCNEPMKEDYDWFTQPLPFGKDGLAHLKCVEVALNEHGPVLAALRRLKTPAPCAVCGGLQTGPGDLCAVGKWCVLCHDTIGPEEPHVTTLLESRRHGNVFGDFHGRASR
jgi:hypothetical protein